MPLLLAAAGLLVVFALLQRFRGESWLWYVPLVGRDLVVHARERHPRDRRRASRWGC